MRHRVSGRKLGRNRNQRQALFRTLLRSLFTHGSIETTQAKAKAILPQAEKMAAMAVKGDLISRRKLFAVFQDRNFVNQVVAIFSQTFPNQKQNFTKLQNIKIRQGDNALIVKLSFIKDLDYKSLPKNESIPSHQKFIKKTVKKSDKKVTKSRSASVRKKESK
ncbi:MAG: 50S ribosomal protein L17 [Candidatus Shapirobacteria bacterium]